MSITIEAGPIQAKSKGEVKRLRSAGFVPFSVQHRGEETAHYQTKEKPLREFITQHGNNARLKIALPEGGGTTVMVHDLQRHPVSQQLMQVTFQKIVHGEQMKAHVAVVLSGEPEAVRLLTAVVDQSITLLEIRCDGESVPEHVFVDISNMTFDHPIHVRDIKLASGEILTSPDALVASLTSLRKAEVPEEAAPATTEQAPTGADQGGSKG